MLRLAVIGCGRMAGELAERAVAMKRARITAIYDPDRDALAARCGQFGATPATKIEDLLGRRDIDAFMVGSPGFRHLENVLAVAGEGKPIYSEKPLTTTPSGCDAMIEACRASGAKLFVGQVLRLFPLFWKSHEIIQAGLVGTAEMVSVLRAGRGIHYSTGWRASFRESGGPLLETHSHELDYLVFLLGRPVSVYARGRNLGGFGDYDESLMITVNFDENRTGTLHGSNASPAGDYHVHIQCSAGNIVHGGFGGELRYQAFDMPKATVVPPDELAAMPNPYDRELESFFDWAEHGAEPLFTGETGRINVAIADAANRSIASGRVEPV